MLDRMMQVAKLRFAMDEADVQRPIHIFGSLDPLSVCLYYIAGAEIFDGLTWLRYAYSNGVCVYMHNHGVKYGLHVGDGLVRSRAITENYYELQSLQQRLIEFEATKNFEKLAPHAAEVGAARDALAARFRGRF